MNIIFKRALNELERNINKASDEQIQSLIEFIKPYIKETNLVSVPKRTRTRKNKGKINVRRKTNKSTGADKPTAESTN